MALATLAWAAAPAQAITTTTFTYTGAEQTFKVPGGVTSIHVVAIGGAGGDASDSVGGAAAEVTGNINVTPGATLYVEVGGVGEDIGEGGEGGFNGGGDGAGGGGGASDIRTLSESSGLSTDTRLIVAAGGGGGGGSGPLGTGANGGAAGEAGANSEFYAGGGAGTSGSGGAGAEGCGNTAGSGTLGEGGAGGNAGVISGPGGGGGGGYYGGGGGAGSCELGSSGGGGGSSLVPPLGLAALSGAAAKVELTYTLVPPTIEITSPVNGATYTQGQAIAAIYSCTPAGGTGVKTCAGPVANGAALDTATLGLHSFEVKAEDLDGGKATQSASYTVVAAKQGPPPPPVPNTVLGSHPKKTIKTDAKKVKVKFTFSSSAAGASFKCKLDKGAFAPCVSPKTYKVKLGQHTFSVEAVSAGATDPTPATFPFKVKKKH